jgi:ribose transport system ATP-binding protein
MQQDEEQPFFQMSGVSKSYGGAVALDRADLAVRKGRIHAILGENGAGKSTLLKSRSRRPPGRMRPASSACIRSCR